MERALAAPQAELQMEPKQAWISKVKILVFLLMFNIQGCKIKNDSKCATDLFFSVIPATVWLILLLLDGQYLACAKTSWSGRFVIVDKDVSQKWCEPANHTVSQDLLIMTQRWIFLSQVIGIWLILLLGLAVGVFKYFKKEKPGHGQNYSSITDDRDPEASLPTDNPDMGGSGNIQLSTIM